MNTHYQKEEKEFQDMKNDRQKCLEEFLNDDVVCKALGLYFWHDRYYEVLPHSLTLKRHNWSGFVRRHYKGKTYMVREASDEIVKKYYPKVWSDDNFGKAIKLNPEIIK